MNLSKAVNTAKSVITANSPVLLVGTALAGVVATGYLAAKGGYRARGVIDDAVEVRAGLGITEPLTAGEKINLTWLCYAPAVLTGASSMAATVGVHAIHNKRQAALAGLYAVASTRIDDLQEKAEELLGPKKTQQLNDAVAQASIDRKDGFVDNEVYILDNGTELCNDEWSGRFFMGSVPIIESAFNKINQQLNEEGNCSLNDFYDAIGLPPIPPGEEMGWSGPRVEAKFGSTTTKDGKPSISYWFRPGPQPSYDKN